MSFERMFEPLQLRHLTISNRIMQTAHTKGYSIAGAESARDRAYYVARARGGVGLIYAGGRTIDPTSVAPGCFASGYVDSVTAADRRITAAVHEFDTKIFAQLNHFGVNSPTDGIDEFHELMSASDVPSPVHGMVPRPLEPGDMAYLDGSWAHAAELIRIGGYDGVELLMAHGYLMHQFFSPLYNKRSDEYGGSVPNRSRLARRALRAVRDRVGDDYIVGVRLSLGDFWEGGLSLEDVIGIAQELVAETRVDFFNLSGPGYHSFFMTVPPVGGPADGWLAEASGRFKAALSSVPVFLVGGIRRPDQVEAILEAGQADMVALTREQIADPEWVAKVRAGRQDQITHCIRANQGCFARSIARGMPLSCTVNPVAGRERIFGDPAARAAEAKSWLVVGGGPAGLKAAATLASRGHRVTLAEASRSLGGQVKLILEAPDRDDFGLLVSDLVRDVERTGVDVRLDMTMDVPTAVAVEADRVLMATGAVPDRRGFSTWNPSVEALDGYEQGFVVSGWDVLAGTAIPEGRVAVLDDNGSRYAAAVTEYLLARAHEVVLVTTRPSLFPDTAPTLDQPLIYERVLSQPFSYHTNSWARSVRPGFVAAYNLYTGADYRIEGVDTVVLVTQRRANDSLYHALRAVLWGVVRVGDCVAPRALDQAIFDGFVAGLELDRTVFPPPGTLEQWEELPLPAPGSHSLRA